MSKVKELVVYDTALVIKSLSSSEISSFQLAMTSIVRASLKKQI